MSTSDCCKDKDRASKSEDDGICEVKDMLHNMNVGDISICANCGNEGTNDNMNTCNKCKQVKYCNAVCKKVHKKKHKKDCDEYVRLAAEKHDEELKLAAELHDEELFKDPPPQYEDCPICFLRIPTLKSGRIYMTCCGKLICGGCFHAPVYDDQGNLVDIDNQNKCPFCRIVAPKSIKKVVETLKKRVEAEDPIAIHNLGIHYRDGAYDFPQDMNKALELWHRAGEHGCSKSYNTIGYAYDNGQGVEVRPNITMKYQPLVDIHLQGII